jgi:hypothetical protein
MPRFQVVQLQLEVLEALAQGRYEMLCNSIC